MTQDTPRLTRSRLALAGAALLVLGGGAGAVVGHAMQRPIEMAPIRPVAIRGLAGTDGIVTVRGKVAAVYGNKFLIDDGSARTLVETGRAGEGGALVAPGALVTVQGRFDDGSFHGSFLVDAAGKVTALHPMDGPRDRRGPDGPPAPRGPHGPGPRDRDAPPPPPPPVDGAEDPAPPSPAAR